MRRCSARPRPPAERCGGPKAASLGRGARVTYLSLTRGEGGQNLIGPELFEDLGVIRTLELLAAREEDGAAQLFGLWVAPEARGSGVATALVRAGAHVAAGEGRSHLLYWVGTDNGRAVAFASGFGFRPTGHRRPMRVVSRDDGEEELAMTLPLAGDRGGIGEY